MVQPTIYPFLFVRLALCFDRVEEQVRGRATSGNSEELIKIEDSGFAAQVALGSFQEAWLKSHERR